MQDTEAKQYKPTPEEKKILKKLEHLRDEGIKYRKQSEEKWREFEDFYRGKHWKQGQKRPQKNFMFSMIEGEVPILTDTMPGVSVVAKKEEQQDRAKILDAALQSVLEANEIGLKTPTLVRNALINTNSYFYVDYDPELDNGIGNCTIEVLPWWRVILDPSADEVQSGSYVIVETPMRIELAKRRYQNVAEFIRPEKFKDNSRNPQGYQSETRHYLNGQSTDTLNRFNGDDMCVVREYWYKCYEMEKVPEEETASIVASEDESLRNGTNPDVSRYHDHDAHIQAHQELRRFIVARAMGINSIPDSIPAEMLSEVEEEVSVALKIIDDHIEMHNILKKENPKNEKPKYINNLRLTITIGDVITYDGQTPVENGLYPIAPFYAYKQGDPYAIGEIENALPMQKVLNDVDWAEYKALMLCSNPGWIIDEKSNVDEETLTDEPGIVIKKVAGTEVRRLEPGMVSPQLQTRRETERRTIESISGVNEVSQGRTPAGVTAAAAMEQLNQMSIGRMRLKSRVLEQYTFPLLGKILTSYIVKFWTTDRKLRMWSGSNKTQYLDYSPSKIQDLEYEVRYVRGTVMGMDKQQIYAFYHSLLVEGYIDPETFFKIVDIPYREKVLESIEQKKKVATQVAMVQPTVDENNKEIAELEAMQQM